MKITTRKLRQKNRKLCQYCNELFHVKGLKMHEKACAKINATEPYQRDACKKCGDTFDVRGLGRHESCCWGIAVSCSPKSIEPTKLKMCAMDEILALQPKLKKEMKEVFAKILDSTIGLADLLIVDDHLNDMQNALDKAL